MNHIDLVNKTTQRVTRWSIETLSQAECYQATNVRDEDTWSLVAVGVPERIASAWQAGDDTALDLPEATS